MSTARAQRAAWLPRPLVRPSGVPGDRRGRAGHRAGRDQPGRLAGTSPTRSRPAEDRPQPADAAPVDPGPGPVRGRQRQLPGDHRRPGRQEVHPGHHLQQAVAVRGRRLGRCVRRLQQHRSEATCRSRPTARRSRSTCRRRRLEPARLDVSKSYVYAEQEGLINKLGDLFGGDPNKLQELYQLAEQKIQAAAHRQRSAPAGASDNTKEMLTQLLKSLGLHQYQHRLRLAIVRHSRVVPRRRPSLLAGGAHLGDPCSARVIYRSVTGTLGA